ncbi:MAG: ABC transporter permease [Thermoanaerobaculia bacterium]
MTTIFQDLRYALRTFAKSPGFASLAILTLALGIGANTAIFSLVHAVLLRPLPFGHADRVVAVMETWRDRRGDVSAGNFADLRAASRSFDRLAAVRYSSLNLAENDAPQRVAGSRVTEDFFGVFGVGPQLGRVFRPEEDRPGAGHVVVLSDRLWRSQFGGAPDVLGRTLRLDGGPYTVVGVMPASFDYTSDNEELWIPAALGAEALANHDKHGLTVYGLLKPNVSVDQATKDAAVVSRDLQRRFPMHNSERGFRVQPLKDLLVEGYRQRLLVLFGAVVLVLLIACTNVSNMLLARGAGRARELTVRAALGASRTRIARQLFTESAVLGLAGGALGVAFAVGAVGALVAASPPGVPRIEQANVDTTALLFALGISLASSLVFGMAPLLRATRRDLQPVLREGGRAPALSARRDRLRTALVAGQIALALLLLVAAGLLIRTAIHLQRVAPGFDPHGVLTARLSLPSSAYADPSAVARAWEAIVAELERTPGVHSAAVTSQVPMGPGGNSNGLIAEAASFDVTKAVDARLRLITPQYLRVMKIPMLRGRPFGPGDIPGSPRVMILSQELGRRLWPGQDPIGKRVACCEGAPEDPRWKTVIGIAGDVRSRGLGEDLYPEFYLPVAQAPDEAWDWIQRTMAIVARSAGADAASLTGAVRTAARAAAPGVPLYDVATMEERMRGSLAQDRFNTLLLVSLGGIGLLLASVGIYGIISYFVVQRRPEFGVRMALGATGADIVRLTVRQSVMPVVLGLAGGVVAAAAASRVLASTLRGVGPRDPLTFAAVVVVLAAAAALASYLPARRAARVDPMTALRSE